MKPSPRSRTTLFPSLQKRLNTYAIAASAAGVSLVALATPTHAEVVYTPADQIIKRGTACNLDLNHDGIIDFVVTDRIVKETSGGGVATFQSLLVKAGTGNLIKGVLNTSTFLYAAALRSGDNVGPGEFYPHSAKMVQEDFFKSGVVYYFGPWNRVRVGYLGFQFRLDGKIHYGWARLGVKFHGGPIGERTWEAHLTGYAYETVAGKPLRAGQTSGSPTEANESNQADPTDASISPNMPAQLGALALGNSAIPLWRRKN